MSKKLNIQNLFNRYWTADRQEAKKIKQQLTMSANAIAVNATRVTGDERKRLEKESKKMRFYANKINLKFKYPHIGGLK